MLGIPDRQDIAVPQNRDTVCRAPAREDALPQKKEDRKQGLGLETPT